MAPLLVQRLGDVLADQIDAGDVEADDARRQAGQLGGVGMDLVGHVEGHVAGADDHHLVAFRRHRAAGVKPWRSTSIFADREAVEADHVQRELVLDAAARVGVDLAVDELVDGGLAVADRPTPPRPCWRRPSCRRPPGMRCSVPLMKRSTITSTLGAASGRPRRPLGVIDVNEHAAGVVAVGGLDHHRVADVLGRGDGFFDAGDHLALGTGTPAGGQQRLGEILLAGDALGDGRGAVGLNRQMQRWRAP